jgi:transmembrane sensor
LKAELSAWLAASEENRNAFEEASAVWELTGRTAPVFQEHWPARPLNGTAKITARRRSKIEPASNSRRIFFGVAGAALAAVIAWIFLPTLWLHIRADYLTAVGERRVIDLADSSRVHLNTQSAVSVNMTGSERRIGLIGGEAFFEVSPDMARPFIVEAGKVTVRVLGTRFNVRLDAASAHVTVASGKVSVSFADTPENEQFIGGQGVAIDADTGQFHRSQISADQVAPWQDAQLIVDNRSVGAVVTELRRYHRGFILLDDELAAKTISGVYNLNDPVGALRAVVQPHRGQIRSLSPYLLVVSSH